MVGCQLKLPMESMLISYIQVSANQLPHVLTLGVVPKKPNIRTQGTGPWLPTNQRSEKSLRSFVDSF